MYGGSAYGAGYYAEGAPPTGERRYGTGSITDFATEPGNTITDRQTVTPSSISDFVGAGGSISDRTSP